MYMKANTVLMILIYAAVLLSLVAGVIIGAVVFNIF